MPVLARAQQPAQWTRADVIQAALSHSARLAAARADTAAASARITTARLLPDPTLAASYTKDIPQYHVTLEMPLDELWLRGDRLHAAEADARATRLRSQFEIAAVTLDVDTLYTRTVAALAHMELSLRNAAAADSLRTIAVARRDAGDASDLEVDMAELAAGQQANQAAADSLTASTMLAELHALIGLPVDSSFIVRDTLAIDPNVVAALPAPAAAPLLVESSRAALESADLSSRVQRHARFGSPGIIAGFDAGDPKGDTRGLLPTIGFSVPIPLFNRNRGPIAEAEAARVRASADLEIARVESAVAIGRAHTEAASAKARLDRDRTLLATADRVATRSLAAYREGAAPLANVLEAQRNAREVRSQYIDDVANLLVATATLRLVTLTPDTAGP